MPTHGTNKTGANAKQAPRQAEAKSGGAKPDEAQRYKPRGNERDLGFARKRDIEDGASQASAPSGPGRYDRTGEDQYAEGLENFEKGGKASPSDASQKPKWELDEGGVQFGRIDKPGGDPDAD